MDIKNSFLSGQIPLIGPPTSHPWLYFGPLFYWLYGPILIIFRFNPLSHIYFGLLVNCLVVVINYLVVKKYWNYKTAILSSFFISISPFLLGFANFSRFYTYTVLFSFLTLYFLEEFIKNRSNLFWLFLSIGILLNFHYSAIVLIPAIFVILFFNRIKLNTVNYIKIILGLFIPLSPLFIYDLQNKFTMTKNIILWFPYRVFSVFHIIPNNNIPKGALLKGIENFIYFMGDLFSDINLKSSNILGLAIVFGIIILFYKYYFRIDKKTKDLFLLITTSLLILVLHGDTPSHYFLVISAYIIIFISSIISNYLPKIISVVLVLILIFISITNVVNYLGLKNKAVKYKNNNITYYSNLRSVTDYINKDSRNSPIAISRVGEFDIYEGNFAQNYQYLLWRDGNEPVKVGNMIVKNVNPKYEYVVIEKQYDYSNLNYINKVEINGVTILKYYYEK